MVEGGRMKILLRQLILIPVAAVIVGCASDSETESEPSGRTKSMQVTGGTVGAIECPGRNSTCYANVRKMCGELGVEEVRSMSQRQVSTAGRGDDDPFARADRQKSYNQPVLLRCKEPK